MASSLTMTIILWHIAIFLIVQGNDTITPRTLKAGFGVNYKNIGRIQPALDRRYLTLDIKLPRYSPVYTDSDFALNCTPLNEKLNSAYQTAKSVCEDFQWLLTNHKNSIHTRDAEIIREIRKIHDVLPLSEFEEELALDRRQKRALPLAFMFGIASGVTSIINTVVMRRKIHMLETAVTALEKTNFKLNERFLDMHKDMISIVQITSDKFEILGKAINATNKVLIKQTDSIRKNMRRTYTILQSQLGVISESMTALASLTTRSIQYTKQIDTHYTEMQWYLEAYKSGLIELMQGKIPTTLIPPELLKHFLDNAMKEIYQDNPNYELVFPSVAHYYRKMDIVYTVRQDHLVVIIPILLKKVNQDPLELYKIESCYVPFNIGTGTQNQATSHTKIVFEKDYLAIDGPNFVEITHSQLELCTEYNKLYLCEEYLLQIDQTSHTCSSAIFWDKDPAIISKHCDFKYVFKIKPPPCILESDDQILLTNLGTKWTFRCEDENVPRRMTGSNFAVIDRSLFCGCALIGQTFFMPQRLENCDDKPKGIKLMYPINAAVATLFGEKIENEMLKTNISALYLEPQDLQIPDLDMTLFPKDDDVLINQDLSQDIDLKRIVQALKDKKKVYLDRPEKTRQNNKVENWFNDLDNVALSVMFILSILGTLAAVIAVVNCVRTNKVMTLFGAMMAMPARTEAFEIGKDYHEYLYLVYNNLIQVLILLCFYAIYQGLSKIYRQCNLVKILAPNTISVSQGHVSHIHLEFGVATMKPCKIYLCSIYTTIMELNVQGDLKFEELRLKASRCKTHAVLKIEWARALFHLRCNRDVVRLPKIAYMSIYGYMSMKKIMQHEFTLRVLVTFDGLTYVLKSQNSTNFGTQTRSISTTASLLDTYIETAESHRRTEEGHPINDPRSPRPPIKPRRLHITGPVRIEQPTIRANIIPNTSTPTSRSYEAPLSINDMLPSVYTEMR